MIVYTVGEIDYDVCREEPLAVFSTREKAKEYIGHNVVWKEDEESGESYGDGHGTCYVIGRFVVDGF